MTEEEVRILVKKSIVRTSDKFTGELMSKVELQTHAEKKIKTHLFLACVICIVLLLFIFKLSLNLNLLNVQINPSPVIIRVIGSLFIFLMLNRLRILRSELLKAQQNLTS